MFKTEIAKMNTLAYSQRKNTLQNAIQPKILQKRQIRKQFTVHIKYNLRWNAEFDDADLLQT